MIHTFSIKQEISLDELNSLCEGFRFPEERLQPLFATYTSNPRVSFEIGSTYPSNGFHTLTFFRYDDPHTLQPQFYVFIEVEPQVMITGRRTIELFIPDTCHISLLERRFADNMRVYTTDDKFTQLSNWLCQRIDYTHNFRFNNSTDKNLFYELTRKCSNYFRREDTFVPNIPRSEQSTAERNNSVKIIFYDKRRQLERLYSGNHHVLTVEEDALLRQANNIIRFEVQCSKGRINSLQNKYNLESRSILHYLNVDIARNTLLTEYERSVGRGKFMYRHFAKKTIDASDFTASTKSKLFQTMQLIAQARHIESAKRQFIEGGTRIKRTNIIVEGSANTFRNRLNRIRSLGLHPVMIPKDRKIPHFTNPIYQLEQL